jgi:hypothetical protein
VRVATIPDDEIWAGATRIVMNPPDGDLTNPTIRAIEMLADRAPDGTQTFSARCVLEPEDLAALQAEGTVWITFYGGVPPFSVTVQPSTGGDLR